MGAKASTIWYVDAPDPVAVLRDHREPDEDAARALAGRLFPGAVIAPRAVGPLSSSAGVDGRGIFIGCYPGITVVCSPQLAIPHPSALPEDWVRPLASEFTHLIAMDPDRAWGAFATWVRGTLRRSFSATTINILEDSGMPLVWERTFWAGERPIAHPPGILPDPQSLPFDPQDFADEANQRNLGFRYSHTPDTSGLDPAGIIVCGFELFAEGEEPPRRAAPPVAPDAKSHSMFRWRRRKAEG